MQVCEKCGASIGDVPFCKKKGTNEVYTVSSVYDSGYFFIQAYKDCPECGATNVLDTSGRIDSVVNAWENKK